MRGKPVRLLAGFALAWLVSACGASPPRSGTLGDAEQAFEPFRHELGPFVVELAGSGWSDARLLASHRTDPSGSLFATLPGRAFLEIARARATLREDGPTRMVEDDVQERCSDQTIESVELEVYVLRIHGRLRCRVLERAYELFIVPEGRDQLRFHVRLEDPTFQRIALTHALAAGEAVFGLGARDHFELRGARYASLAVGADGATPRRAFPWSRASASGSRAPAAHWTTSEGRALWIEGPGYVAFDLSRGGELRAEHHGGELTFRVVHGATPTDRVRVFTAAGGPLALPAWSYGGPILSVGGGEEAVHAAVAMLTGEGVVPAAVHVRDAIAAGSIASPDPQVYPAWSGLVEELRRAGIRILLDASPRFEAGAAQAARDAGVALLLEPTELAYLDVFSPAARRWWTERLRVGRIEAGASGFLLRDAAGPPAALGGSARIASNGYAAGVAAAAAEASGPGGASLTDAAFVGSAAHGAAYFAGSIGDPHTLARILSAGVSGHPVPWVRAEAGSAGEAALGWAGFLPILVVAAETSEQPSGRTALVRSARIHAAWAGYRAELVRQARERGLPVIRPVWLHYPDVPAFQDAEPESFLVGSELLVVPTDGRATAIEATVPPGRWVDVFHGDVYGQPGSKASRRRLRAPAGLPAVLHPDGSIVGMRMRKALGSLR